MIVELSPVYVGFSNFGSDVFKGLQMGGGQNVLLDNLSLT